MGRKKTNQQQCSVICSYCKFEGHHVSKCDIVSSLICRICGNKGHISKNCKNKMCGFCENLDLPFHGHTIRDCEELKNTECLKCKAYGHTEGYCKDYRKEGNSDDDETTTTTVAMEEGNERVQTNLKTYAGVISGTTDTTKLDIVTENPLVMDGKEENAPMSQGDACNTMLAPKIIGYRARKFTSLEEMKNFTSNPRKYQDEFYDMYQPVMVEKCNGLVFYPNLCQFLSSELPG